MNKKWIICTVLACLCNYMYSAEQSRMGTSGRISRLAGRDLMIFDEYEGHVNARDAWGDTKLHDAINDQDTTRVVELLRQGAPCTLANQLGETPLALAFKKNNLVIKQCFERYGGCLFVSHADLGIENTSLISLLSNNAQLFYAIVNRGLHQPGVSTIIEKIKEVFAAAEKNAHRYQEQGVIVTYDDVDCFVKTTMLTLDTQFGEAIQRVKHLINLYDVAKKFLTECTNENFQQIYHTLQNNTDLAHNLLCNHYIFLQFITKANRNPLHWEVLFRKGFNATVCLEGEDNSLLHWAALLHNDEALYYLVYNGADYSKMNVRGKTPIDLLVACFANEKYAHKACLSLLRVQKALHDRMRSLQEKGIDNTTPLLEMSDLIQRALSNSK